MSTSGLCGKNVKILKVYLKYKLNQKIFKINYILYYNGNNKMNIDNKEKINTNI